MAKLSAFPSCNSRFWSGHPALFVCIPAILGVYVPKITLAYLSCLALLLLFPFILSFDYQRIALFILTLLLFSYHSYQAHFVPFLPQKGVHGEAEIEIIAIAEGRKHHYAFWKYQAYLRLFSSEEGPLPLHRKSPITFTMPKNSARLLGHGTYKISGTLLPTEHDKLLFKPDKKSQPIFLEQGWHLGELRFLTKKHVESYLKSNFTEERSRSFIQGLATGDFQDPTMMQELGRFGLQHIMAISGFHFSILTVLLASILRGFLSRRSLAILLIALLSSYFLLLGLRPSIFRAWLGASLYLSSTLIERINSPLNNLGIALMILLVIDPLYLFNIGCQLSFLASAAILFFYQPCHGAITKILRKRNLSEASQMNSTNQHGYLLLSFFVSGLALSLAVHGVLLPYLLQIFGKFPVLSILYNLFFPFAVSIIMCLLIIGSFCSLICPPLAVMIHQVNQSLTEALLGMVYNIPTSFDSVIQVEEISPTFVGLFLVAALHLGIYCYQLHREAKEELFYCL